MKWPFPRNPTPPAVVLRRPPNVLVEPVDRAGDQTIYQVSWTRSSGDRSSVWINGEKFALAFANELAGIKPPG